MTPAKTVKPIRSKVTYVTIDDDSSGQRIDNFLVRQLKGMPKTHIYRLIRKGEVRVNKRRIDASYRLKPADCVRLPPLYLAEQAQAAPASEQTLLLLKQRILYEDDNFLIINKPCGMSVHVGSTVRIGVIEAMRQLYPHLKQLELAHRLDSETSGCLILAKRKRILREVHELLREGKIKKHYWALTQGIWKKNERRVTLSLRKHFEDGGKHVVNVDAEGKQALSIFTPLKVFGKKASLVQVELMTGRTHQIRVHASHMGHAIAGDDRYGDLEFSKFARQLGLKRMFLHAHSIDFVLPSLKQSIRVVAPLDTELNTVLDNFAKSLP